MRINKKTKKMLQDAFEAPEPMRKEAFLKQLPKAQISHVEFMVLQTAYIKKWVWLASLFLFGIALKGASFLERDMLWKISALMPFIALAVTTENARSAAYGMEELEMASRFSLRSVLLARLGILGASHLLLLCFLIPVSLRSNLYSPLQTGIYLTVPYLLTVVSGFMAARKIHGKESLYACMGIAAMVSVLDITLGGSAAAVYSAEYFFWWIAAFFLLSVILAAECRRTIKEAEELTWNLQ